MKFVHWRAEDFASSLWSWNQSNIFKRVFVFLKKCATPIPVLKTWQASSQSLKAEIASIFSSFWNTDPDFLSSVVYLKHPTIHQPFKDRDRGTCSMRQDFLQSQGRTTETVQAQAAPAGHLAPSEDHYPFSPSTPNSTIHQENGISDPPLHLFQTRSRIQMHK